MTEAGFQIVQKSYELALILIQMGVIVSLFLIFVPTDLISKKKSAAFIIVLAVERLIVSLIPYNTNGVFFAIALITFILFFWKRDRKTLPLFVYLFFLWYSVFSICFIITGMISDHISDALLDMVDYNLPNAMSAVYKQLTIWIIVMIAIYLAGVSVELLVIKAIVKKKYLMTFKQSVFLSAYAVVALLLMYMVSDISVVPLEKEVFVFADQSLGLQIKLPVIALLLYLGQLGGLVLWQEFQKLKEKELENREIISRNEYSRKYIDDLDSYYNRIRILRHDMAGKLTALRGLMETDTNEAALKYLTQMDVELNQTSQKISTGNPLLNVILNEKYNIAKDKGIEVICDLSLTKENAEMDYDIGVIVNNLLDNAIEATEKYGGLERKIMIQSLIRENFYVIEVKNTFDGDIRFKDGLPVSTKGGDHGFGLKSVKRLAEKNMGGMTVENKDGWFVVRVMLQDQDRI